MGWHDFGLSGLYLSEFWVDGILSCLGFELLELELSEYWIIIIFAIGELRFAL